MTNTSTKTEATTEATAGTPWERAARQHEKPPLERQDARPNNESDPSGSERTDAAIASGPNRPALRPAAAAEGMGSGSTTHRSTQVAEGEHRKESAKRN